MTLAFTVKSPFKIRSGLFPKGYRESWLEIWHKDPCRDGTDDSCGWFMRSRHGDPVVLERIVKRFEYDWDRTWTSDSSGKTYYSGYFTPAGYPNLSVSAVALNLFFIAAIEVFGSREKAVRWMQKRLCEILLFAENPFDSLHDGFTLKYGNDQSRSDRIRSTAVCIYGWILRDTRPWWKHPRWHVHHWKFSFPLLSKLRKQLSSLL